MQENRPFDHHFGTLRGVRGFNDPRAVNINLPLQSGTGTTPASVFLQPAGAANVAAGFGVPPLRQPGWPGGWGADVIPPFRVNPETISPGLTSLGLTYLPGTDHSWGATHAAWNQGQYDSWAITNGPMAMSYMTREDIPYHYALADAFTVGDAYHCSIMGPTNPNRMYLWTGCVGNVNYLGAGGTDGYGRRAGHLQRPQRQQCVLGLEDVPRSAAGGRRKLEDLPGHRRDTFSPDFGDGTGNSFAGNYTDNSLLYFNQYATAAAEHAAIQRRVYGHGDHATPSRARRHPSHAWQAWAESLFAEFRSDVQSGKLPQVSWLSGPPVIPNTRITRSTTAPGTSPRSSDILVSNPEVFSKTVFIVNYDEADGSFDHIVPPTPPQTPAYGASTVSIENEIVTVGWPPTPNGPIGLGTRVPFLAISPWSKGGYVNSQVFDHTSVIQFIEKRFGVLRDEYHPVAPCGDWRPDVGLQLCQPECRSGHLPSTTAYLPSVAELVGGNVNTFVPTLDSVIIGVPAQEKGIRPARALPYELNVHATGQCFDQHRGPEILQHRQRDSGVSGAFRQPVGSGAQLHGGTRQETVGFVECCYDLQSLGLRPQRLRALLQWQHWRRRRNSQCHELV